MQCEATAAACLRRQDVSTAPHHERSALEGGAPRSAPNDHSPYLFRCTCVEHIQTALHIRCSNATWRPSVSHSDQPGALLGLTEAAQCVVLQTAIREACLQRGCAPAVQNHHQLLGVPWRVAQAAADCRLDLRDDLLGRKCGQGKLECCSGKSPGQLLDQATNLVGESNHVHLLSDGTRCG